MIMDQHHKMRTCVAVSLATIEHPAAEQTQVLMSIKHLSGE